MIQEVTVLTGAIRDFFFFNLSYLGIHVMTLNLRYGPLVAIKRIIFTIQHRALRNMMTFMGFPSISTIICLVQYLLATQTM